eukprot:5641867-Lingulodinium_polyedra.AAC.1
MRSGKSDFSAGRSSFAFGAFLLARPALAAGMAPLRGAARGRPRVQPLSNRTPCVQRAGMSEGVLTATGRGRCWGR